MISFKFRVKTITASLLLLNIILVILASGLTKGNQTKVEKTRNKAIIFHRQYYCLQKRKNKRIFRNTISIDFKMFCKVVRSIYANTDYIPIYLRQLENSIFHNNKTWDFLGIKPTNRICKISMDRITRVYWKT